MPGLLDIFSPTNRPATVSEYLDCSAYDELAEIDLAEGRCRTLYHAEGKYFVPVTDGSLASMYDYAVDNMVHPEDRNVFAQLFDPESLSQRLAESEIPGALSAQFRYRLQDGGWRWTEVCLVGDGRQGVSRGIVRFYIFDIEHQVTRLGGGAESACLANGQNRDAKTGLLSEGQFLGRIASAAEGSEGPFCLIAIDIDHFRLFNEWYGREAGDFLLAEFGARLAEEEKQGGVAGYRGRDDFCLAIPFDKQRIDGLYNDLCDIVASRGTAAGFMPVFGVSIAETGVTGFELLDQALLAIGKAKSDYRKRICLFKEPMREQEEREYRILSEFVHALDNAEFFFQLQPQCHAATRKIVGAEALARWRKSDGSIVSPADFVPVLERHGFITNLDCFVWEEVCIWLRSWIDSGHVPIPISVNVSQVDFYALDVPAHFEQLVGEYGLDPSLVKIEITESAYIDDSSTINNAATRLRDKGFLVLMDDFGSGYSSLNALGSLNIDVIKLDAQFLRMESGAGHKGVHILESVINMANVLGLPIISEGVETEEQSRFLESQGCNYIQGYLFYRPMDADQFEDIIADERIVDTRGLTAPVSERFHTRELFDKNVYSDTMLNSILGAVALYTWDGVDVNIVRFNEEFQQTVHARDFYENLQGIQRLMDPVRVPDLYRLLSEAEEKQLTGSNGILQFQRFDGSPCRYFFRFFYLGEKDGRKRFYGSVRDVTELTELQEEVKLLSHFSLGTIAFVKKRVDGRKCIVVAHGLKDIMGLPMSVLQAEMNSGAYFERFDSETGDALRQVVFRPEDADGPVEFFVHDKAGQAVKLRARADVVEDDASDVASILIIDAI